MQSKYYIIPNTADLDSVKTWADDPHHHCVVIAQGRVGEVAHSLCVHQPSGMTGLFELTESALEGMITESAWPE